MNQSDQNNTNQGQKVFTKVVKGLEIPTPQGNPILSGEFSKKGSIFKSKRYFVLYRDYIFYYENSKSKVPKGFTQIDFDLHFEMIREGKIQQNEVFPPVIGILLTRDNAKTEIYHNQQLVLQDWRQKMKKLINQKGFHGQFQGQKKIGQGNFASVYLATKIENQRMYAIKAFSKEISFAEENGKESLINEIKILRTLHHPNIVKLHEVYQTENSIYLVLEYLEGGSLYDKQKKKQKFTLCDIRIMMKGIISGLQYLDQKGIIHRDMKPENLMFQRSDDLSSVIIADFGLATLQDQKKFLYARCGTPGYVAPEIVNIKDLNTTYTTVSDMYALGIILHTLLFGRSPFHGSNYTEILQNNRKGIVNFHNQQYTRLNEETFDLLQKLLEKDPKKRLNQKNILDHKYFNEKLYIKASKESLVSRKKMSLQQSDLQKILEDEAKEDQSQKFSYDMDSTDLKNHHRNRMNSFKEKYELNNQVLCSSFNGNSINDLPQFNPKNSCLNFQMNHNQLARKNTGDSNQSQSSNSVGSSPQKFGSLDNSPYKMKSKESPIKSNSNKKSSFNLHQIRESEDDIFEDLTISKKPKYKLSLEFNYANKI